MKESIESKLQEAVKEGSGARKFAFAAGFLALGLSFVLLGLWRTLFLLALTCLGYFLGSRDSLSEAIKQLINKLFPPSSKAVSYSAEDIEKVKRALDRKETAKGEEPADA